MSSLMKMEIVNLEYMFKFKCGLYEFFNLYLTFFTLEIITFQMLSHNLIILCFFILQLRCISMISFVNKEDKELRNWRIESYNRHKLSQIDSERPYTYFKDMYGILKKIEDDNDAVVLAVFGIDLESDFTEYALQDMVNDLKLVEYFKSYEDWCENSVDSTLLDLRQVLSFYNIDNHGDEEELLSKIGEHDIPLVEDWLNDFSRLSQEGKQLLDDLGWVKIYEDFLDRFDFNEFYHFIENKSGKIEDVAFEFLDEHLILAKTDEDEEYIHHCEVAKDLILKFWKDSFELKNSKSRIMEKFETYIEDKYKAKEEYDLLEAKRREELLKNIPSPMTEIDFCNLADNKYRLVPRENDSYVMPVRLKQFEYYHAVEELNDADLALHDLAFVPWCFRERLRDASFEEGFLTHNACKENWNDFSKDLRDWKLRKFLEKYGIDSFGSKKELVERIAKNNLPLDELVCEKTFLSKKAYDFFKEHEWIQYYLDKLYSFDFLDYEDYLENYEGTFYQGTFDYLNEHIKLANQSFDFNYIIKSYEAKAKVCRSMARMDYALECEMRILHLNMNPVCLNGNFSSHIPLVPENVTNLKKLRLRFGKEKIRESFDENWNFMGFNSFIIPKEEVWSYLIAALNAPYENHGSGKIRDKYFRVLK